MNQHTPTPWTVYNAHLQNESTGDEFPTITAWDEKGDCSVTVAICSPDADAVYENAAFIVRAVNTHEDLLAACRRVVEVDDRVASTMPSEVVDQCRAALAKAVGR